MRDLDAADVPQIQPGGPTCSSSSTTRIRVRLSEINTSTASGTSTAELARDWTTTGRWASAGATHRP